MEAFKPVAEYIAMLVDIAGVAVIAGGFLIAAFRALLYIRVRAEAYRALRQELGRAILLGLEFLVAADIIRTVIVERTLESVLALGIIVLIRTFLSFTIEVELDGYWPWQYARYRHVGARASAKARSSNQSPSATSEYDLAEEDQAEKAAAKQTGRAGDSPAENSSKKQ